LDGKIVVFWKKEPGSRKKASASKFSDCGHYDLHRVLVTPAGLGTLVAH
jgi:hypothetical protein